METCTRLENPAYLLDTVQIAVLRTDGCDIILSPYQLTKRQNKSQPPHAATASTTLSNCKRQTSNSTGWNKSWLSAPKQRWCMGVSDRTLGGRMKGSGVFRLWVEVHVLTDKRCQTSSLCAVRIGGHNRFGSLNTFYAQYSEKKNMMTLNIPRHTGMDKNWKQMLEPQISVFSTATHFY